MAAQWPLEGICGPLCAALRELQDELAAARVDTGLNSLESAIVGALFRAQGQGELGADKDPQALARSLLTVLQGIRVIAKRPDRQRLRDTVDYALALLD